MTTTLLGRPTKVQREWRAQPRQRDFLRATEFAVLYGGAAGGGKSDALLIDGIRTCVKYAGAGVLFLRRTYADLVKPRAAIPRSHELLNGTGPQWRGDEHSWQFPNGSVLQFGHLQHETSIYSYQGSQPDRVEWDELTQFERGQFWFLTSRVRTVIPGLQPGIRAGTNPGNVGHQWVKEVFIDPAPANTSFEIREENQTMSARFVPAKVQDNRALLDVDPGYVDRLGMLPPDLRRAYLDGDWDIFAGQFFSEWRREKHVCKPFAIPHNWPRWRSTDYGYGAPFCTLWFARDPATRRIYVYRELYRTGLTAEQQAVWVRKSSEGETCLAHYADPSMWSKQPNGQSIAQMYAAQGVDLTKANNDRPAGWTRLHKALDGDEPEVQVFETCVNLIRTVPSLVHDSHDVEDLDTDGEDHAADAWRYGMMGEPRQAAPRTGYQLNARQQQQTSWLDEAMNGGVNVIRRGNGHNGNGHINGHTNGNGHNGHH
ncbi:MAG: terminase family protein [Patescibacteria group bacterium]|nr:terminase family protein [Patescibacteria group bacterium]